MFRDAVRNDQLNDDHPMLSAGGTVIGCVGAENECSILANLAGCGCLELEGFEFNRSVLDWLTVVEQNRSLRGIRLNPITAASCQQAARDHPKQDSFREHISTARR